MNIKAQSYRCSVNLFNDKVLDNMQDFSSLLIKICLQLNSTEKENLSQKMSCTDFCRLFARSII